eukprot:2853979-Pleurochrysis_carterae.AAC.1
MEREGSYRWTVTNPRMKAGPSPSRRMALLAARVWRARVRAGRGHRACVRIGGGLCRAFVVDAPNAAERRARLALLERAAR